MLARPVATQAKLPEQASTSSASSSGRCCASHYIDPYDDSYLIHTVSEPASARGRAVWRMLGLATGAGRHAAPHGRPSAAAAPPAAAGATPPHGVRASPAAPAPAAPAASMPAAAAARGMPLSYLCLGPVAAAAIQFSDDALALVASLPRTLRTLAWAVRSGLSYKQLLVQAPGMSQEQLQQSLSELHDYWAERLLEVCRTNGGVYVKAGQFAAAFSGVPPEYRKHLALLQDKAKPRPFSYVERVIRSELGAPSDTVFAEFHAEATAAASLAQVHRARLADGREVAVKVQYPGLRGAARADLSTLSLMSAAATLAFPEFKLTWLYTELRAKLDEELDFSVEVCNAQKLLSKLPASNGTRCVAVPRIHIHLCTSKVLTMEWVAGHKVNDAPALRAAGISPRAVGLRLDHAFAEMVFEHGFVHADPHPGNIMVRPRGRPSLLHWLLRGSWQPFEVVLLDHGSYLDLSEARRREYCLLWAALFAGDRGTAADVAVRLGGSRAGQILPVILTQRARNKQEREAMQRAAGVASFGDITQLLNTAPRDVVELLRITAVVRTNTASLGCSLADRTRISGAHALRGLAGWRPGPSEASCDASWGRLGWRANVLARLALLQGYVWVAAVLERSLVAALSVFGQDVVMT